MQRDTQRKKLYLAQEVLQGAGVTAVVDAPDGMFPSIAAAYEWACSTMTADWFAGQWPSVNPASVTFVKGRADTVRWSAKAHWRRSGVHLVRFYTPCPTVTTVIHELAHLCARAEEGGLEEAWHGWRFCQTYATLIGQYLGENAAVMLRASYETRGVKWTEPRARVRVELTAEQRAAVGVRLTAARVAKGGLRWRRTQAPFSYTDRDRTVESHFCETEPWSAFFTLYHGNDAQVSGFYRTVTAARKDMRVAATEMAQAHPGETVRVTLRAEPVHGSTFEKWEAVWTEPATPELAAADVSPGALVTVR